MRSMTEINSLAMQTGKVMYVYALSGVDMKLDDLDEEYYECEQIARDWLNEVDIENEEEQGYIYHYAERKLKEKFL